MNITIANRKKIEKLAENPFSSATALISCTDIENDPVKLQNMPDYVLRLQFDDVGIEDFADFENNLPSEEEVSRLSRYYHIITDEQAIQVANFYNEIKDKVELLICQCEHGESRSVAIAAAIKQYECGEGIGYFVDERYFPNKTVYKKVYKALSHKSCLMGDQRKE